MFEVIKGKINELGDASEKVWRTTNGKGFTPLSLAAHLGECNLFSKIIEQKVNLTLTLFEVLYIIYLFNLCRTSNTVSISLF